MAKSAEELKGPGAWFYPVAGAAGVAAVVLLYILLRPYYTPTGAADYYIDALNAGRCEKAYGAVSYYARMNYPDYGTYERFERSVCAGAREKYRLIRIYRFENTEYGGRTARVECLLRFKTSWMPKPMNRLYAFNLRRDGRRWKMDGPELLP